MYYDPGVGTIGDQRALIRAEKAVTRARAGTIGFGIKEKVRAAYEFLAWHYQPDDRIFTFGFSRGAYKVRALAALILMYGLTEAGCGNLSPYLLNMLYDDENDEAGGSELLAYCLFFQENFRRRIEIDFLGVFDTVSSVGWFWNALTLPHTRCNKLVQCVRRAGSIDERRAFFRTNLFFPAPKQDFKEIWFAGVHSDVGGGYESNERGLAQIPFDWMIREARAKGLAADATRLADVLSGRTYAKPDPSAESHYSLTTKWLPLEFLPRPRNFRYVDEHGNRHWQSPIHFNMTRRRKIPSNATVHQSVVDRYKQNSGYRPKNLGDPNDYKIEAWFWCVGTCLKKDFMSAIANYSQEVPI